MYGAIQWLKKVIAPSLGLILVTMLVIYVLGIISDPFWDGSMDNIAWCIFGGAFLFCVIIGTINYQHTNGQEGFTPIKAFKAELGGHEE